MNRAADNETKQSAATSGTQYAASLTLGISPVEFSGEHVRIGRLDSTNDTSISDLRREHRTTHAFRFDARDGKIANIGVRPGIEPLGEIEEVPIAAHLLLLAEAISHQLRQWFSGNRKILRPFHPLVCLGSRDRLLANALRQSGVQSPDGRLDVVAKWSFDLRLLSSADPELHLSLGLIADVGTSNVIDIPVSELQESGFDPVGCYVGTQGEPDELTGSSRLRLLGRIRNIDKGQLVLDDVREDSGTDRIAAADVFVEARRETLEAVTRVLYPSAADRALEALRRTRAPYISGDGKLKKIRRTIEDLNKSSRNTIEGALNLRFGDGLGAQFGPLLDRSSPAFPKMLETNRPTMLFGASGHDQDTQPDLGIRRHGPFQYAHNAVNDPIVAVLCDKSAKGRMEQFAKALRDGIDDDNGRFSGGLVGKFRLTNMRFHLVEIAGDTAESYANAATRALEELPQTPALALVQVREAHKQRLSGQNPYFVAKGRFMRAGVPVQAVRMETIRAGLRPCFQAQQPGACGLCQDRRRAVGDLNTRGGDP